MNRTLRTKVHFAISFVAVLFFVGCGGRNEDAAKELDLSSRPIQRITIADKNGRSVELMDSVGIQYFVGQLRSLPSREEGNVENEFILTVCQAPEMSAVGTFKSHVTTLRLGKGFIGPMVPASEVVKRWYFETDSLYNFVRSKLYASGSRHNR